MPKSEDKEEFREYARGYNDGRNGEFKEKGSILGAFMPGLDPLGTSEAYREGNKDGKQDTKK